MPGGNGDKPGDKLPALKPPPQPSPLRGGPGPSTAQVRRARSVFESAPRSSLPAAKILYGGGAPERPAVRAVPAQAPAAAHPEPPAHPAPPAAERGRPLTPALPPLRQATPPQTPAAAPSAPFTGRRGSTPDNAPASRPGSRPSDASTHGNEASLPSLTPTPPATPAPARPGRTHPRLHFPPIDTPAASPRSEPEPLVLGHGGNQLHLPALPPRRARTPEPRTARPGTPAAGPAPGEFPVITNPRAIERAADYEGSNPVFNAMRSVVDRVRMSTPERREVATLREKVAAAQESDRRNIGGLAGHETRAKAFGHASTAVSAVGSAIPLPSAGVAGSLVSASLTGAQAASERAAAQRYERAAAYEVAPPGGGPGYMQAQADLRHAAARQHGAAALATASQIPGASMVAKRATAGAVDDARHTVMTQVAHASGMGGRQRSNSQEFDNLPRTPPRSPR